MSRTSISLLQFLMTDESKENKPFSFSVPRPTLAELQDDIQKLENDITARLDELEGKYMGLRFIEINLSSPKVRIDCLINSHQHTKH